MKAARTSSPQRMPLASGRVFRLTYSNATPDDKPELFKCRDAIAFCELAAPLFEKGCRYGTTIHLYPDDERQLPAFPAFHPSDILVLTTRPPLHDKVGIIPPRRKVIHAAKTELEAVLFEEFSKYIEYCTRKHVELAEHGVNCLRSPERQNWRHVELFEYCAAEKYAAAEIQKHHVGPEEVRCQPNHHSTVAFFLRANELPRINCAFVASFGMDGYGTLIWNRIIRQQYPEWLSSPGFKMAELVFKKPIPVKPITPEFADDGECVEVRLLT